MLDIQQLRKDLPTIVAGLARRNVIFDEAQFRALEDERKKLQTETEELQAKRNAASKQIGMMKAKGEDTTAVMAEVAAGIKDDVAQIHALILFNISLIGHPSSKLHVWNCM